MNMNRAKFRMTIHFRWIMLALLSGSVFAPGMAHAHVFDIAVIAPYSGPQAHIGPSLWHGMRVATREFDGHAFETADGHLGGVDSNLIRIDIAEGTEALPAQLQRFIDTQNVVIAVLAPGLSGIRDAWPGDLPAVIILAGQDEAVSWPGAFAPPHTSGESGEAFATTYRHQYQDSPDAAARGGYAAARLIAAAVRPFDGHFADLPALHDTFARKLSEARR